MACTFEFCLQVIFRVGSNPYYIGDYGFGSVFEQQLFSDYSLDQVHFGIFFLFHYGQWFIERLHFPIKYVMTNNKYRHVVLDCREKVANVLAFERRSVTGFELTLNLYSSPFGWRRCRGFTSVVDQFH